MADLRPPPQEVARRAAAACERAGVEYAIIGGLAVGAFGVPRVTKDADLIVALGKDDGERIDRFLAELEKEEFRLNRDAVRRRFARGPNLLTTYLGMTRLDVLLKRPDAYWQDALAHRRKLAMEGHALYFASPEDVVALKLVAARPNDLEDVKRVLAVKRKELDRPRLRATVARFAARLEKPGLVADLERALAEADSLPENPDLDA